MRSQRHCLIRFDGIDIKSQMIGIWVEFLLKSVQLHRNYFVSGVAVGGGVSKAEKLAETVRREVEIGGDNEGQAFAGGVVGGSIDIDKERRIKRGYGGCLIRINIAFPELERLPEEDPAGSVCHGEDILAAAGIRSHLEGIVGDCRRLYNLEYLAVVVGVVEGTILAGKCFELLGLGESGGDTKEDDERCC